MQKDLRRRTKEYALRIIKLIEALPKTTAGRTVSNQLIRCGTSIGANYRAALRGRSKAEFIAKIGIVIEEADESAFWLEIIIESGLLKSKSVEPLLQETKEILAIMITTSNTAFKDNN
ncbi:four helix bundle protein [Candidatus Parcubacteria bacterium]|nr:four helix bundle protein [Candidatus Parcubacteria bacterium]